MKKFILALFVATLGQSIAFASEDRLTNYDSIVKELNSSSSYDARQDLAKDPLDTVKFHFGAGMITSQISLDAPAYIHRSTTMRGFELSFAIDLFSPDWRAQTNIRAYQPEEIANNEISFKEFDLLFLHAANLGPQLNWLAGGGLAARYLDFKRPIAPNIDPSNSTPASVLTTGLEFALSSTFSIDANVSYRNRLVQNTSDAGSIDGTLRLSSHF